MAARKEAVFFGVSCGDTAPFLEKEESIFDKMPQFIEFLLA
jgi:hypothetical protein